MKFLTKKNEYKFTLILLLFLAVGLSVYNIIGSYFELGRFGKIDCPGNTKENRVLILGDSLTKGQISENYIELLERKFQKLSFINAGANSALVYHLNKKFNKITSCESDTLIVFIGINDINGASSKNSGIYYQKTIGVPELPSLSYFKKNYNELVEKINAKGFKRVFLISPPPIGQNLNYRQNQLAVKFVEYIKEIANTNNFEFINFFEEIANKIKKYPIEKSCENNIYFVKESIFQHFVLRKSWNEISDKRGFKFTTDCLHLNTNAAKDLTGLISLRLNTH